MNRTIKQRVLALLAVLVLASVMAAGARADLSYSGYLDPVTNEPVARSDSADTTGRVQLSNSMFYDWNTHDFVFPVENSLTEVHCTAADGMVLTRAVSISVETENVILVYRNGEEYTGDRSAINQPGEYTVSVRNGDNWRRLFSFLLVDSMTNMVHTFTVPDGFYIVGATRDGENIYSDRYRLNMEPEGSYVIEYECTYTEIVYTLETIIDRTPPELTFGGVIDSRGRVHSALSISGMEEGDTFYILRDETVEVTPTKEVDGTYTLPDSGNYRMQVFDYAGNSVEYVFTILTYFNASSWVFFGLVLDTLGAVIGYILIKRRRLKIG